MNMNDNEIISFEDKNRIDYVFKYFHDYQGSFKFIDDKTLLLTASSSDGILKAIKINTRYTILDSYQFFRCKNIKKKIIGKIIDNKIKTKIENYNFELIYFYLSSSDLLITSVLLYKRMHHKSYYGDSAEIIIKNLKSIELVNFKYDDLLTSINSKSR